MSLRLPSRPDWRWTRVTELAQSSELTASARLREGDEETRRLYAFRRALDRRYDGGDGDLKEAYEIYKNEPSHRMFLEGLILAGEDDAAIEQATGFTPGTARAYHDAFFDIRPILKYPLRVCAVVFSGFPHQSLHGLDKIGTSHRIAWFAGKAALVKYCTQGMTPGLFTEITGLIKRFLLQHAVDTALVGARHSEVAPEFLKLALEKPEEDDKEGSSAKPNTQAALERAVNSFMEHVSISVADPTDSNNLKQPARELREHEYEVHDV